MFLDDIFLILGFFTFFYVFIPVLRVFIIENFWGKIRSVAVKISRYQNVLDQTDNEEGENRIAFGYLDGIGEKKTFWMDGGSLLLEIPIKTNRIFLLPSHAGRDREMINVRDHKASPLIRISKNQILQFTSSLSSPRVMVAGVFSETRGIMDIAPEFIIFYEGKDDRVIERILDSSSIRQSPVSFSIFFLYGVGVFIFSLSAYFLENVYHFVSDITTLFFWTLAMMPLFFFFPPSVFFLYAFRKVGKKSNRILYRIYLSKLYGNSKKQYHDLTKKRLTLLMVNLFLIVLIHISAFGMAYLSVLIIDLILQ